MARNNSVIMSAPCKWAKVLPDQLDVGKFSKKYGGEWSIDLIFDGTESTSFDELRALGVAAERFRITTPDGKTIKLEDASPDDFSNGELFLRVRRKFSVGEDGFEQGPPRVIGTERDAETGRYAEFTEEIGNGSKVRVAFEFFGTGEKQGLCLNDVQVLEHVPYGRPQDNRGLLEDLDEDSVV